MTNPQKLGTDRMWSGVHRVRRSSSYALMRRDAHSAEGEAWTQVSVFNDPAKAAEALDEAVASGEGELDDYRVDELVPPATPWFRRWTQLSRRT